MKKLFYLTLVVSTAALAQEVERDFGDLIPETHFTITQAKTTLKDNADISNYKIEVTPKREEFTYDVAGVKTPLKKFSYKRHNFKLAVDRENGRVARVSSVGFTDNQGERDVHSVQSSSITPAGHVDSFTYCYDQYANGPFGIKKDKSGFQCVTVNKEVCAYFEKNEIDEKLVNKISECSEAMGKLAGYQKDLYALTKAGQSKDLQAIKKINGSIGSTKNYNEIDVKTLEGISQTVSGYGSALSYCEYFKEKKYFSEDTPVTSGEENGGAREN